MDKVTTALYGVIAILPFQPSKPALETYEWLTDISNSRNGSETRLQLRGSPRSRIAYEVPHTAAQRARAFNDAYGALRARWGVPVWSQAQDVGAVSSAATSIACTVTPYDFRDDSLALVYADDSSFAVVQIDTVGVGIINLTAAVGTTFASAALMPLRVGYLAGDAQYTRTGWSDKAKLTFDIEDNAELAVSAPTQFLSNDIYFDEMLKGGETYDATLLSREEQADYDLGAIDRLAPWLYTRHLQTFQRLTETPTEAFAFRQWLHRRAGKYRAFWLPSFENDMRVANTSTITTTLRWRKDSYDEWATARTHIAIEDTSGNWYARTLSAVSSFDSTTLQGTLNTAVNLAPSLVRRISYLGLRRMASDAAKMEWIGNGVSRCSFGVLELQP